MSGNNKSSQGNLQTRSLQCLDGIHRLVSLEGHYWAGYDWLIQDRGVSADNLLIYAWDMAVDKNDAEVIYHDCLMWSITDHYYIHLAVLDNLANDSWPLPDVDYGPYKARKNYPEKLIFPTVFYLFKFVPRALDYTVLTENRNW